MEQSVNSDDLQQESPEAGGVHLHSTSRCEGLAHWLDCPLVLLCYREKQPESGDLKCKIEADLKGSKWYM